MARFSRPHLEIPPAGGQVSPVAQPALAFIYAASHGIENALTGKPFTTKNGISLQDRLLGRGFKAVSNASIGAAFSGSPLSTSNGAGTGDFTVLVIGDPVASTTREMLYSCNNGSQEFYFVVNANVGLTATSGAVSPQTNAGGASGVSQSGGADGKLHAWAYRRQSSTGTLYRDGVSVASGAITPNQMWSSTSADYIGGYSGANWGVSRSVRLVVGWNRALTDAELAAYTRSIDAAAKLLWLPRRIFVPVSAGGSFSATGALAADAATISGSASHLTLHPSSGALSADSATLAGTATHLTLHTATGALAADAATVAGSASLTSTGSFSATGDLSADAATLSGAAAHYTLHTATGAIAADAATLAGTATHLTLHTATGALIADAASVSGVAVHSGDGAVEEARQQGGGKSKKRDKPVVVEIDGQDFVVGSEDEAIALLDQAKEEAEQVAKVQIERAARAEKRKPGKVVADARKTLVVPQIKAPGLEEYASQILADIRDSYASAMRTIEVAALLRKREREEEDDEDVLMLML